MSEAPVLRTPLAGGLVLVEGSGDFVLSIEVPQEFALEREAREDPPAGWPFREFWLSPDEANSFRDAVIVLDPADGEEVRPDLVGR